MIYTIQRRTERNSGLLETHYELMSYTHISNIGCYVNPTMVKSFKKKSDALKYTKENNIKVEE